MWSYVLFISIVTLFCTSFYKVLPLEYILLGMMVLFCLTFLKMFLENLEKKYYYDKKYLWNFSLGMFLLIIYSFGSVLDFLGYIKFIGYFGFLWAIAPTLYLYGLRRLMHLKILSEKSDEKILKRYKLFNDSLKTFYVLDILMLLLYIMVIWKNAYNIFSF